jgi:hypothetical protein
MEGTKGKSDITKINVDYPEGGSPFLRVSVGACRLRGTPGEGKPWVSGAYYDPTHGLPAEIVQEGDSLRITQKQRWSEILGWLSGVPEFDLSFGTARPYRMMLESGASEIDLDLGGVPLNGLEVKHGAGKIEIDFSEPNPQEMSMLSLGTGAGSVVVKNIANANIAEMALEGGAASYTLDFGGKLQRSGHVRISTGVSAVTAYLPAKTAARLYSDSVLGGFNADEGFVKKDGGYSTAAALEGVQPMLSIHLSMALGSLTLRTT